MSDSPDATKASPDKTSEKNSVVGDGAPATQTVALHKGDIQADIHNVYDDQDFYTKYGLNLDSFRMRHYGPGIVELDRKMRSRHLHMIAIGGSIGAGFFVGSGGAL